jgi:hypothetical protein
MFWGEFYFSDGNCTFFLNPLHYLAVKVCSVTGPSWNGLGRPGWGPVSTSLGTLALQVWLREATLSLGVEWSCIWADCSWPSHWSAPQYIQTVEWPIASFRGYVWVQFLRATPAPSPPPVCQKLLWWVPRCHIPCRSWALLCLHFHGEIRGKDLLLKKVLKRLESLRD